MRLSDYHFATRRETPKDADSANAAFLTRGRYVERGMTGVYNFLPLGWMVMENITVVVRRHMNATGALEGRFSTLQDKPLWERSGRWRSLKDVMYQFTDQSEREVGLACTHEEVVVDLLGRQPLSYADFPYKVYQFQTKFRHEPRAKSGLLRGREFLMKDLYSAHAAREDLVEYYGLVRKAYTAIFDDLSIPTYETLASGGAFTDNFSHEFQAVTSVGEDEIYICDSCHTAVNREIIDRVDHRCPACQSGNLRVEQAIEVGNVFDLGTYYSEKMNVLYTDKDGGLKPFWFASYGIGISRAMATIVELHHDEKGIMWPAGVAPFKAHLVGLNDVAGKAYDQLVKAGVAILYDDRPLSAGEKFIDADLLGMPIRLTVGNKTPEGMVEWRPRSGGETEVIAIEEAGNRLRNL